MIIDADMISVGVEMMTRYLYEGHLTVTFTKKDGSIRTMNCTKQLALIPQEKHPKTTVVNEGLVVTAVKETRERDPQLITVFDVDKQEWRSFRYTTVKDIKFPDRPNV
jgi:hypothetical protein